MQREIKFRGINPYTNTWEIWVPEFDKQGDDFWSLCSNFCQYTGFKIRGFQELYQDDILFQEHEHDEGDEVVFYVVTWITERGAFALLEAGERIAYDDNGIDGIKRDLEGFYYELDQASIDAMHYKGSIHTNPQLLKGGRI